MTEARRALVTAGVALLVVALFVLALWVAEVLLLVFAGILLALLLRGIADWLAARAPVSPGVALAAVVVSLVALVGVGGWLLADELASQFDQLVAQVPQALASMREQIAQYAWGRSLLARLPAAESLASSGTLARATGLLSTTLGTTIGLVANVVIVAFVALYVAADPGVYTRGVVRLVPRAGRDRAREVLGVLGHTLRRWLVGKLLAMVVIAVFTGGGLWLIGVPLALMLGVLAGVLNFVPYLGPVLAFLPAALLALTTSPVTALWVLGLYVVVQSLESYVLTPLVDQRSVSLPPALTIAAQVVLGIVVGWLGLVLASPLTAVAMVLVRMLYVEDALGDDADRLADAQAPSRHRLRQVRR